VAGVPIPGTYQEEDEGLGSRETAEAAGNLLLHFDHAQIALGQIVVKIDAQVFQEAEEGVLVFAQPIKQIAGGTLFGSSTCSRWRKISWMDRIPFIKQGHELGFLSHYLFLPC